MECLISSSISYFYQNTPAALLKLGSLLQIDSTLQIGPKFLGSSKLKLEIASLQQNNSA